MTKPPAAKPGLPRSRIDRGVPVTFYLPAVTAATLKAEALKQGIAYSRLLRIIVEDGARKLTETNDGD